MEHAKRKSPLWLKLLIATGAALIVLALVGVGLRYWITSDGGRGFLASQIDGRRIGPLGAIRVSGLKGDPLTAASLADIALVDDDGVWLRARDARIEWSPFKLFGGELEIAAINVRQIDVQRQPRTTYEAQRRGSANIGINLDSVVIDELKLASGVFGPAASFSVSGGFGRARDASGFARLTVTPLAGPGDNVNASAQWSAQGALTGAAAATGPAGGALAALLQAPETAPVAFNATLAGTLAKFTANARLSFADMPVATLDIARDGVRGTLDAQIAAADWPLLEPVARRTGGPVRITGEAGLANLAAADVRVSLDAPAGRITAAGAMDINKPGAPETFALTAERLDLGLVAPPLKGLATASGPARYASWNDWSWTADASVDDLAFPSGAAKRAIGPITVGKTDAAITWASDRIIVEGGRITSLRNLAPSRYEIAAQGEVNLKTRIVEISRSQVGGEPGDASARGTYNIETGALALEGAAAFARLSDVAPLTGSVRGQWTVKRASETAPIRLTADAAGRNVGSRIDALAQVAGASPRVMLSAVVQRGRFVIESGQFDGDVVAARMTGRVSEAGVIAAQAEGRIRRPLALGGATIQALDFTASVSGQTKAPRVDLDLSGGRMTVAGLDLANVGGEAGVTLGERIAGRFALTGAADAQPLALNGRIAGGGGAYRLEDVRGRVGGLVVAAPLLSYANGDLAAVFRADGSLAGLFDIERGALAAQGNIRSEDGVMTLDVSGQATDIRRGDARLRLVSFDADSTGDTAKLSGRLRGRVGAELDLDFSTDAARADAGWRGEASLNGKVDDLPVSTAQPVNWAFGADGWTVDGVLSALNGRIEASAAAGDAGHTTRVSIADIDLRALTRLARVNPVGGRISGISTFSNIDGVAIADLDLSLADANPVGVTADPVSMTMKGQLRDGRFSATAEGAGQGFRLDAAALIPFDIGEGFNVAPSFTREMRANLALDGRAQQAWALFGPEGQSLRGAVKADVRVAGTLERPLLEGGFSLADGVYQHGEAGLNLRDINGSGVFDQRSAKITSLTASDGQGGRLTGEGDIVWDNELDGGIRFTATDLRALNRDDRFAIVSGQGAVSLEPEAIIVSGDLQVQQARISIEQPASASIPTLPSVRRVNFPSRGEEDAPVAAAPQRPVRLDLKVVAPRRVVVFGRGLDTEWGADFAVTGPIANPEINGTAMLVRGTLDLASQRFDFDTGSIRLEGPIRTARIDISAKRDADDIDAIVRVTGTPSDIEFTLTSTPALPQDEILARVIFGRSASELSGLEAAQLAASLTQLAGGQAAFDPAGVLRDATGLDRVAIGASGGAATVQAGKYIAEDVYLQLGAGGEGGVGAEVEWEPRDGLSVTSSAQGNGDSRLSVRWKKDY
jgi:translocation and assembly module TamB